jgi:ABC-type glutathione transport system ATPase component
LFANGHEKQEATSHFHDGLEHATTIEALGCILGHAHQASLVARATAVALGKGDHRMIQVDNVSQTFVGRRGASVDALRNINLEVEGEFVAVVGRSGCGKFTLLD